MSGGMIVDATATHAKPQIFFFFQIFIVYIDTLIQLSYNKTYVLAAVGLWEEINTPGVYRVFCFSIP